MRGQAFLQSDLKHRLLQRLDHEPTVLAPASSAGKRSPMFGVWGKITMAPDFETLISCTTCLRPRKSSTPVFDKAACLGSFRSSIVRRSWRGIIDPSRVKLDATRLLPPHFRQPWKLASLA